MSRIVTNGIETYYGQEGDGQSIVCIHGLGIGVDLIKDRSEARLELDGEVVQEDGHFVWEQA